MAYTSIKRGLDIIFSFLFLIIFSPIFLILYVLFLITSGRPVIFNQARVGQNGTIFMMYKFRTMVVGARDMQEHGEEIKKLITPIGGLIRPIHLDELPQLWNILKGDMSFVGPRPLMIHDYKRHVKLDSDFKKIYHNKPGLTSLDAVLAYISDKRKKRIMKKLGLKLSSNKKLHPKTSKRYHKKKQERGHYYFENKSFILDLKIIYWTLILELERIKKLL